MKKLHSYMNPFQKWKVRWKLRRIIVALEEQMDSNSLVHNFARSLEATEIMSRGMKKDAQCVIKIERAELDSFIRYMCSLHDSKLSRVMLARVGLACLMVRDEDALKERPEIVLQQESNRSGNSGKQILTEVGKQLDI